MLTGKLIITEVDNAKEQIVQYVMPEDVYQPFYFFCKYCGGDKKNLLAFIEFVDNMEDRDKPKKYRNRSLAEFIKPHVVKKHWGLRHPQFEDFLSFN